MVERINDKDPKTKVIKSLLLDNKPWTGSEMKSQTAYLSTCSPERVLYPPGRIGTDHLVRLVSSLMLTATISEIEIRP